MKNIFRKLTVLVAIVLCFAQTCQVYAAENSKITLENQEIDTEKGTMQVNCAISGADQVTNGKLRILYDGSQLHLKANEKGDIVSNALCELNDCINGNKEEGEIVIAFASAGGLPAEGYLTNMTFELDENVKADDVIKITVAVEKLAGNNGDLPVEKKDLSVSVSKKGEEMDPGEETANEDYSKGQSGSNQQNTGSGQSSAGGKTDAGKPVDTGDYVNVLWPAAMMAAAGAVIVGIVRKRKPGKKQKR
ncbi:MAG: hypothetical protein ACI4D3_09290 [Lachnospiraceae bacterium]